MYKIFLEAHSGIRWLFLLVALAVIVKSLISMNKKYEKIDNILSASYVGFFHLQVLLGLLLLFVFSPLAQAGFSDMAATMKDSALRKVIIEHPLMMIIAAGIAQFGRIKIKKATEDKTKFRKTLIFTIISLVIALAMIPWDRDF